MRMPAVLFTIMPRNYGAFYYWNRQFYQEMLKIRQHCGMEGEE